MEEGAEFDPEQVPEALRTNFFGEPEDFADTRSQTDEKILFLKTTAALGTRHRLNLSAMHFPNSKSNWAGFTRNDGGPIGGRTLPSAGQTIRISGQQYKGNLLLALGPSGLLETNVGVLRSTETTSPNELRPPHETFPDFESGRPSQSGSEYVSRKLQFSSDLTWHVDHWGGTHRFKAGVRLIRDIYRTERFAFDDIVVYATNDRSTPVITIQPRSLDPRGFAWDLLLVSKALYVQDSWRPTPRLTLNLGYRFDITAPFDHPNHSLRAGFAWDWTDDGKTVLRGHYGRFYDGGLGNLPLLVEDLGGAKFDFVIWSGLARHLGGDGEPISESASQVVALDRPFRTPYTDGLVLGIEREIAAGWSASAEYVRRNSEDVLGARLVNWDSERHETSDGGPVEWTVGNWNFSRFRSLQLTVRKRFSDRAQLLASYSYSNWRDLGQDDIFSLPDDEANPEGDYAAAESSIPHAFKLSGFCVLPADFRASVILVAQSGLPFSAAATEDLDGDGFTERPPEAPLRNGIPARPVRQPGRQAEQGRSTWQRRGRADCRCLQRDESRQCAGRVRSVWIGQLRGSPVVLPGPHPSAGRALHLLRGAATAA